MDTFGLTEHLSCYIIRPPRPQYNISDLGTLNINEGQTKFEYKSIIYQRIDFTVPPSNNNLSLQCSLYVDKSRSNKQRITVIYLHANSSNRCSAQEIFNFSKNYLKYLIPHFDVVTFDFKGCGKSQGKYLTLGYLQKWDVKAVIEFVDAHFGVRKYMLWGRSMGAVTAILYTAKFQCNTDKVLALVLDSPFADLWKLIYYISQKKLPLLPRFMMQNALQNLQDYAKKLIKTQYNKQFLISKHKPLKQISKIRSPMFYIGGRDDQLVDSKQVIQMYQNSFCNKQLQILDGGHNQPRPQHLKLTIVEFLLASLNFKKSNLNRKKIFSYQITTPSNFSQSNLQNSNKKYLQPSNNKAQVKNRKQILFKNNSPNSIENKQMKLGHKSMLEPPITHRNVSQNVESEQNPNNKIIVKQLNKQISEKSLPKSHMKKINRIFVETPNYQIIKDSNFKSQVKSQNAIQNLF